MIDLLVRLRAALAERYAIERELGQGGMAVVFLAQDLKHRRAVAIKVLRPELAMALGADRFLGEIETVAGLAHPHILPLYDSGEAAGFLYYVMPYVEGESLRERLTREKQLPLEDALRIAGEVATALSYAHSRGVVHRDIKPENILLEAGQAIVSDFGIARAITVASGERLTQTGVTVGTPGYMSPEQAAGERELDGRSDVYSLACVLYEMLAGNPPFLGTSARAILARQSLDPVPRLRTVRETVPEEFERAVVKALAKAPADRFATATQFVEALVTGRFVPRASRRALLIRVALPLVAVLTAIGAVVLARRVSLPGNPTALDANVVAVAPFDVLEPNLTRWREGLVDVLSGPLSQRPRGVVRARRCTDALAAGRAHDAGADPGGLRSRDCPRLGLRPGLHPSRRGCPPAGAPYCRSALPRRIPRPRPSRCEQRGDGVGRAAAGSPAAFASQRPRSDRHGLELCPGSGLERAAAPPGFRRNRRGVGPSARGQPPHGRSRFG